MSTLDDVYDPATVRVIDSWPATGRSESVAGVRGSALAAALLFAGLEGGRAALEDREPEIVELTPDPGLDPDAAVSVFFVPGAPSATVAVVRPWLLASGGPPITGFRVIKGIPGGVTPPP